MTETEIRVREYPEHPLLGRRLAEFDPKSLNHGIRELVGDSRPIITKAWGRAMPALDQGRTSQCTAYSAKGALNTTPIAAFNKYAIRRGLSEQKVYDLAQRRDEWPGEDYDGSSVLAAAKALKELGLIHGYRWCFGVNDVLRTLSYYGPVVIGISWYDSMFETTPGGYLKVDYDSELVGGHAIQILGVNATYKRVRLVNSWGPEWGQSGRCYLKFADLEKLLNDDGEAVTYT